MSKTATLSVPAITAAPSVKLDYNNDIYSGTKADTMEYALLTDAGWSVSWTAVTEKNMPVSAVRAGATKIAFRNKAKYNKRASAVRILDVPAASDITMFEIVIIDGKEYLKAGTTDKNFAVLTTEGEGAGVVGKSKFGEGYNGSAIPITYGNNKRNVVQYRLYNQSVDEKFNTQIRVVKNWTNITWKPMDNGTSEYYAVFDISGAALTPAAGNTATDGYFIELRIKGNTAVTEENPDITAPSMAQELYLPERAAIAKVVKNGAIAAEGDISYSYDEEEDLYQIVQVMNTPEMEGSQNDDFTHLTNGNGSSQIVYEVSLDKVTWYSANIENGNHENQPIDGVMYINHEDYGTGVFVKPTTADKKLNTVYIRKPAVYPTSVQRSENGNFNTNEQIETLQSMSQTVAVTLPTIAELTTEQLNKIKQIEVIDNMTDYITDYPISKDDNGSTYGYIIPAGTPTLEVLKRVWDGTTNPAVYEDTWITINKSTSPQYIYGYSLVKNGVLVKPTPGKLIPAGSEPLFNGYHYDIVIRVKTLANTGTPLVINGSEVATLSSPINPSYEITDNFKNSGAKEASDASVSDENDKIEVAVNSYNTGIGRTTGGSVRGLWYRMNGKTPNPKNDEMVKDFLAEGSEEDFIPKDEGKYYFYVLDGLGNKYPIAIISNVLTVTEEQIEYWESR
jgi:hypothetical protein